MYASQVTGGRAGERRALVGSRFEHRARIDTRLVAAVQARAGARTHEAAGLLNRYQLWATVLADVGPRPAKGLNTDALRQFTAAKIRLREFLSGLQPAAG